MPSLHDAMEEAAREAKDRLWAPYRAAKAAHADALAAFKELDEPRGLRRWLALCGVWEAPSVAAWNSALEATVEAERRMEGCRPSREDLDDAAHRARLPFLARPRPVPVPVVVMEEAGGSPSLASDDFEPDGFDYSKP